MSDPNSDPFAGAEGAFGLMDENTNTVTTPASDPFAAAEDAFGLKPQSTAGAVSGPVKVGRALDSLLGTGENGAVTKEFRETRLSIQNATLEDAQTIAETGGARPAKAWLSRVLGVDSVEEAYENPLDALRHYQLKAMADIADPADVSGFLANEIGVAVLGGNTNGIRGVGIGTIPNFVTGGRIQEWSKKGTAMGDAARWMYGQSGRKWLEPEELHALQKSNPVEFQQQMRAQSGMLASAVEGMKDLLAAPVRIPAMLIGVADNPVAGSAVVGASMFAQSNEALGRAATGNLGGVLAQDPVGVGTELAGGLGKATRLGGAAAAVKVANKGGDLSTAGKAVALSKAYWSKATRSEAKRALLEMNKNLDDVIRDSGHRAGVGVTDGKQNTIGQSVGQTLKGDLSIPANAIKRVVADNTLPLARAPKGAVDVFRNSNIDSAAIAAKLEDANGAFLDAVGAKNLVNMERGVARNLGAGPRVNPEIAARYREMQNLAAETTNPKKLMEYLDVVRKTSEAFDARPDGVSLSKLGKHFERNRGKLGDIGFVKLLREDAEVMKFANAVTEGSAGKLQLRLAEGLDPLHINGVSASSLEGVGHLYGLVKSGRKLSDVVKHLTPNPKVAGSAEYLNMQRLYAQEVLDPLVRSGRHQPIEQLGKLLHANVVDRMDGTRAMDPLPGMLNDIAEATSFKLTEALSAGSLSRANLPVHLRKAKVVENFDISDRMISSIGRSKSKRDASTGTLVTLEDGTKWFQPSKTADAWGNLRGRWIDQDSAAKFAELSGLTSNSIDKVRGFISRNWVIYNPKSHGSALVGDLVVLMENGVKNPLKSMKTWSSIMAGRGGTATEKAKFKLARESGVTAGSQLAFLDPEGSQHGVKAPPKLTLDEALRVMKDFDPESVGTATQKTIDHVFGAAGIFEAMFNAREKAYRMTLWDQEYTRLVKFTHGDGPLPGGLLVDKALAHKASEYALTQGFDYNLTPSGTRIRLPNGKREVAINNVVTNTMLPFLRYSQAVQSSMQRVFATSTANNLLTPANMKTASSTSFAMDDSLTDQRGQEARDRATIGLGNVALNAISLNPMTIPLKDVIDIIEGADARDVSPIAKALSDVSKNKGEAGLPIYGETDSMPSKMANVSSFMIGAFLLPKWYTKLNAQRKKIGTVDSMGNEYSVVEELINQVVTIQFRASESQARFLQATNRKYQKDLRHAQHDPKKPEEQARRLKAIARAYHRTIERDWPE